MNVRVVQIGPYLKSAIKKTNIKNLRFSKLCSRRNVEISISKPTPLVRFSSKQYDFVRKGFLNLL